MKNRKLKVRLGFYDLPRSRDNPHLDAYRTNPQVPFVLLKGYWLEKANFRIGKSVDVEVRENQLILTVGPL